MPIYEYVCKKCEKPFEKLVRSMSGGQEEEAVECPHCGSKKTERAMSVFAVKGEPAGSGGGHGGGCACCSQGRSRGGACPLEE
jgi:putative FmdB family regulatory protein